MKDRMIKFLVSSQINNSPCDLNVGDTVMTLTEIDAHIGLKNAMNPGSKGHIVSISHRYKGEANEHYEYWVSCGNKKGRYEINNIVPYDTAEQILLDIK